MLFSIIVPVYNVASCLDKCITSLREQTYRDIEIILVDDGSTDSSSELCDHYAKADSRIRVIHKENGGLSDARNKGMELATGKYILFVDSDDYINQDACEKLSKYTTQNCDILVADAVCEGRNMDLSHIQQTGQVFTGTEYLLMAHQAEKASMAVWLNIYRRKFLLEHALIFKFGILHEDEQFTPRAFLKANTVLCTGIMFYHYVIRDGSITTNTDQRKNASDLYGSCCELEALYQKLNEPKLRKYLLDSLSRMCLNVFQIGRLYQYGDAFLYKAFVLRNAKLPRTRLKAVLYVVSPRLYYSINKRYKKGLSHV